MLKPAAIPVTLGWGTAIRFLAMDLLFGLLARALRRDGEERFLPALARRQAFLLIPPAFLIAHFGSFARATLASYLYSYIWILVCYA